MDTDESADAITVDACASNIDGLVRFNDFPTKLNK